MSDQRFRARIRMYRQGIGDCFLVQLPRADHDQPFNMVIDCGVVLGTPDGAARMRRVVDSLQRATGGDPDEQTPGTIDLLVITHEHWDHVSAFNQVDDWDKRFVVTRGWAGWTENPDDAQARQLDQAKRMALAGLAAAASRLGLSGDPEAAQLNQMLGFYGMGPLADPSALGARATTRDGRDKALALAGSALEFLEPGGRPLRLQDVPGARAFVLGPPRNKRLLKKADPSKADPETYGLGEEDDIMLRLAALTSAMEADGGNPFSAFLAIPESEAEAMPFFRDHYFAATAENGKDELDDALRDESWRRIDHDWLGVAAELAMKLDRAVNNTSLALAIELERDGDVLLFPADAQVGNWLSWHDVGWRGDGAGTTARDLLQRTVFYKVGHHGSHNATLRDQGLELMTSPRLMAMVPVDRAVAKKKGWDEMPLDELMARLNEKTQGRVLCADDATFPKKPPRVRKSVWEAFVKTVSVPPAGSAEESLYFQVEL